MGSAERRLSILKYLCQVRQATMVELSKRFAVSVRTIQRDIYEIEATFRVPIVVKCGKYDGGVSIVGNYRFDRMYMNQEELGLLCRIQTLLDGQLQQSDSARLSAIIQKYSGIA